MPHPQSSSWEFLSSVQSLSCVQLFATPWTAAHQASLSVTNSQSLLNLMSIKSVMLSNHLILCHLLFPLRPIFPSIRVLSNESVLCIRWPKYWSFRISPSNEYSGLISFRIWSSLSCLQSKELSRVFSNIIVQKHQFFWVSQLLQYLTLVAQAKHLGVILRCSLQERQRRKRKIYPSECRVPKNSKER